MGRTYKDQKDFRNDKARKFNRDEHRKKKHEKNALRSVDVERLIEVENESGNTFYTADGIDYQENRSLWPVGCESEKEFLNEIGVDDSNYSEYEEWLQKQGKN